jgi:hypothetical protein
MDTGVGEQIDTHRTHAPYTRPRRHLCAHGSRTQGTQVPWNAALYAKDPVDYQKAAETEASMYESSEASELLDMAVEYNVLPPKKEKKFRRDLQTGDMKAATLVGNLQVLRGALTVCLALSPCLPPSVCLCRVWLCQLPSPLTPIVWVHVRLDWSNGVDRFLVCWWQVLLRPVFKLKAQIRQMERAAREAKVDAH